MSVHVTTPVRPWSEARHPLYAPRPAPQQEEHGKWVGGAGWAAGEGIHSGLAGRTRRPCSRPASRRWSSAILLSMRASHMACHTCQSPKPAAQMTGVRCTEGGLRSRAAGLPWRLLSRVGRLGR